MGALINDMTCHDASQKQADKGLQASSVPHPLTMQQQDGCIDFCLGYHKCCC